MPADPVHDYFALLGAPRHFDVSQPALELAFKEAQKLLHPDKVSMRQEVRASRDCVTGGGTNSDSDILPPAQEERQHSADQASRLNTAYAVLRSPLSRARYLVRSKGGMAGGARRWRLFYVRADDWRLVIAAVPSRRDIQPERGGGHEQR